MDFKYESLDQRVSRLRNSTPRKPSRSKDSKREVYGKIITKINMNEHLINIVKEQPRKVGITKRIIWQKTKIINKNHQR